jgi:DNA-binding transcriptional LysR family regulator
LLGLSTRPVSFSMRLSGVVTVITIEDRLRRLGRSQAACAKTYAARTRWRFRTGGRAKEIDILPHMIVSDYTAPANLCSLGCGIALLPSFPCDAAILDEALVGVLPGSFVAGESVFAVSPLNMRKAPRVAIIREAVRHALQA